MSTDVAASRGTTPRRMVNTRSLNKTITSMEDAGRSIQDRDDEHHTGGNKFLARIAALSCGANTGMVKRRGR